MAQIVYYDGQFDDSRLNVSLACTAAMAGATVLNYAEVTRVIKVTAANVPLGPLHPALEAAISCRL